MFVNISEINCGKKRQRQFTVSLGTSTTNTNFSQLEWKLFISKILRPRRLLVIVSPKRYVKEAQLLFNMILFSQIVIPSYDITSRSSHPEVFCKKGVLKNVTKFTGRHLCQSLFFNKVTDLRPATLLKKRLWHNCLL